MTVRLDRIVTRTGDAGETGLVGGTRVPKHHPRVSAYGEVDELSAVLGWAQAGLRVAYGIPVEVRAALGALLDGVQRDLFALAAELATPAAGPEGAVAHASGSCSPLATPAADHEPPPPLGGGCAHPRVGVGGTGAGGARTHAESRPYGPTPQPQSPGDDRRPIDAAHLAALEAALDRWNEGLPALAGFVVPGAGECSARLHVARTVCRRAERTMWALAAAEPLRPELPRYLNRLSDLLFVLARRAAWEQGEGEPLWPRP